MSFLARTPVIWTSFVLMLVIGVGFSLFRPMVGGALLDMTSDPEAARTIIATMSDAQRTAHAWVTVLLDTAYPLAYVDLTENLVQVLALAGWVDALDAKAWLTPLKFGLFFLAAGLAVIALLIGVVNLLRKRRA